MKLSNSETEFDNSFTGKVYTLPIIASAKAMEVLSKSLYSNSIKAVVREISTNAYDSHVEAGVKDKPFDVTLPTKNSNFFSVRDYGIGIPPDKFLDIYAPYFSSSKTNSNNTVGCFGLGSKSPLAISDQFTVEVWYGGRHYVWHIAKDENGIPGVINGKPIVDEESNEPTGVLVKVPVSQNSYDAFVSECEDIYKYFSVRPNVFNAELSIEEDEKIYTSDEYDVCKKSTGRVYALMGNVCYPVDPKFFQKISNKNIILKFPIGSIFFTPSRETLEYNTSTINALKQKRQFIINNTIKIIQKDIDSKTSMMSAYKALMQYKNSYNDIIQSSAPIKYNGVVIENFFKHGQTNYDDAVLRDKNVKLIIAHLKKSSTKYEISIDINLPLYYNDEGLPDNKITPKLRQQVPGCYYLTSDTNIDKWLEINGATLSDLLPTSSIKYSKPARAYTGDNKTAGIYRIAGGDTQLYFWDELKSQEKLPDKAYYVIKEGRVFLLSSGNRYFPSKWNKAVNDGVLPKNIYGVSKTSLKNIPKGWVPLEDYAREYFNKEKDNIASAFSHLYTSSRTLEQVKVFKPELTQTIHDIRKHCDKIDSYKEILNIISFDSKNLKSSISIDDVYKNLISQYPLLELFYDCYDSAKMNRLKSDIYLYMKAKQ